MKRSDLRQDCAESRASEAGLSNMVEEVETIKSIPHANPKKTRIDKIRQVVAERQCCRIHGLLMDFQTANLVVQIYDRLNTTNQAKLDAMPLAKMVDMCWKLYNKVKA